MTKTKNDTPTEHSNAHTTITILSMDLTMRWKRAPSLFRSLFALCSNSMCATTSGRACTCRRCSSSAATRDNGGRSGRFAEQSLEVPPCLYHADTDRCLQVAIDNQRASAPPLTQCMARLLFSDGIYSLAERTILTLSIHGITKLNDPPL
jgi:hypothetical protein